jgi:hypothetical protein
MAEPREIRVSVTIKVHPSNDVTADCLSLLALCIIASAEIAGQNPLHTLSLALLVLWSEVTRFDVQSRNGKITLANDAAAEIDSADDERMYYVRLRIRDDRLAKLWVWKLAEHDVIVWSEAEDCWKKLLAVPELRMAVRKATTTAFARKSTAPPAPDSRTRKRHLQSVSEQDPEELTTRLSRSSSYPDLEPTAVDYRARFLPPPSSAPPPPPNVDPMLRALSTTMPPAMHSSVPPQFPRPPRVPTISELAQLQSAKPREQEDYQPRTSFLRPAARSDQPESGSVPAAFQSQFPQVGSEYPQAGSDYPPAASQYPQAPSNHPQAYSDYALVRSHYPQPRPRYVAARPASPFSIKNVSLAMMPVACAAVFAIFLDRYIPYRIAAAYAPQGAAVAAQTREAAAIPAGTGVDQFASTLESLTGMSLGQAKVTETAPAALTPDQLASVTSASKAPPVTRAVRSVRGAVKAPWAAASDKGQAIATNAAPAAQAQASTDDNGFDKEGARTALKFAAARARNCSNSGMSGSALITFGPAGTVQKVQISQLVGDDVDQSCVNRALSGTRIPPFVGAPVTVRKSF